MGDLYYDNDMDKINVNITTYPKRDKFLFTCLNNFKNQTLKCDRLILWLCEEEYDKNNLPNAIVSCLNQNLITEIKWLKKNIFCHKRAEVFKYYNDDYNIIIDDDLLYDENYVATLMDNSTKNANNVTCMASLFVDYIGTTKIQKPLQSKQSFHNALLCGLACFPPNTFPLESFQYSELRDKYVSKCDESWLTPFLIKNEISINAIHDFAKYKIEKISGSQIVALYNENKKFVNGIRFKETLFANAVKISHTEQYIMDVFPKFDIDKCSTINNVLKI